MLLSNFIDLFLESAFWLLLGLFLAGMLKMFVPMSWMNKQLGGHGFKSIVKAAILGAPLPLCSCGVIPAAVGLRRAGASKAATTSFLISTPETGVDSVTISYVLLGPFMAVVRPIAAIMSAIVAGLLVGKDEDFEERQALANALSKNINDSRADNPSVKGKPTKLVFASNQSGVKNGFSRDKLNSTKFVFDAKPSQAKSSCCSNVKETESCCGSQQKQPSNDCDEGASCCSSTEDIADKLKQTSVLSRMAKGMHFAANDLVRDTALWLLVGLFFAAIVQTYISTDFLTEWGDGVLAMLVMVIISIPMYICATASTPIAAGLLLAGVSPGAVLVFMLAGPATNIATLGVVGKELGKRALWSYLSGVLGVALFSGVIVNYLVDTWGFEVMPQIGEQHELLPVSLTYISGFILAILMFKVIVEMLQKKIKPAKGCCS
jgi:uncharacterized membrane protein YraQ (UPF0718 family)